LLRPITPLEFSIHLRIGPRQTRRILHNLVELQIFTVASGIKRARSYMLK
jgi:hypothetical protein